MFERRVMFTETYCKVFYSFRDRIRLYLPVAKIYARRNYPLKTILWRNYYYSNYMELDCQSYHSLREGESYFASVYMRSVRAWNMCVR